MYRKLNQAEQNRKTWLLIIGDFIDRLLIVTTGIIPLCFLHAAKSTTFFRLSRKSKGSHPVHAIMALHTDPCGKREV